MVNTRSEQTRQLVRKIKRLFEKLAMTLDFYASIPITIGIGTIVSDPAEIADSACAPRRSRCASSAFWARTAIYYSEEHDRDNLGVQLSGAQIEGLRALLDENRPSRWPTGWRALYRKPEHYYRSIPLKRWP